MSKLGLATSEADLAKYPLFSPILGGISKLVKIELHRIGSKFICSLLGPIPKAEKFSARMEHFWRKLAPIDFPKPSILGGLGPSKMEKIRSKKIFENFSQTSAPGYIDPEKLEKGV